MKDVGPGLDWFFFFLPFFGVWMSSCSSTICWKNCLCSIVLPLFLCRRSVSCTYQAYSYVSIPPLNFNGVCCCYFIIILNVTFGEGNGNPLQYSCLENPTDWEALWATVHGVTKSQTQVKWLSKLDCKALHLLSFTGWLNINL